jgi:transcription antitermination protein NusB
LLRNAIIKNEGTLLALIYEAAPKYEIKSIPIINALILLICLAEIFVVQTKDVPTLVAVNEAIELSKRYSDEAGKNLINGILNTLLTDEVKIRETLSQKKPLLYSFFHT